MQETIRKNAHTVQYALDDMPDDAVERLLKGVFQKSKEREYEYVEYGKGGSRHLKKAVQ